MSGQFARQFLAGLATATYLGLAVAAGFLSVTARAENGIRDEEPPPDLEYIRSRAQAGVAKAQTLLADFHATAGDFTNALVWYRKAAEQDDVGAQLTLASFLITGQGTKKNPAEAARWLREAARLIESPAAKPQSGSAATPVASIPTKPHSDLSAKASVSSDPIAPTTNSPGTANPNPTPETPLARAPRVHALAVAAPVLQSPQPVLKSYSETR